MGGSGFKGCVFGVGPGTSLQVLLWDLGLGVSSMGPGAWLGHSSVLAWCGPGAELECPHRLLR